jgi:hypothetical protein
VWHAPLLCARRFGTLPSHPILCHAPAVSLALSSAAGREGRLKLLMQYYTLISAVSPSLCTLLFSPFIPVHAFLYLAPCACHPGTDITPAIGQTYFLASKFHFGLRSRNCDSLSEQQFSVLIIIMISIHTISSLSCIRIW